MWIKTLYDEIVNTDSMHVIYISTVDCGQDAFNNMWAVRAVVGGENQVVTLYECENEHAAKYKLDKILNKLDNIIDVEDY